MYQVQVNKGVLRNHFQYDSWKYVVGVIVTILMWNLVTTIAAPRTPDDKKVDIYLVGGYMMDDSAQQIGNTILEDFPELMEVNFYNIHLEGEMEYAGRQKLMVMLASQSGDLYVFDKREFEVLAKQDAFLPLDGYDALTSLFTEEQLAELTLTSDDDPTPRLYGLPLNEISLLEETLFDTSNAVVSVMTYSRNSEKALEVLEWILTR